MHGKSLEWEGSLGNSFVALYFFFLP